MPIFNRRLRLDIFGEQFLDQRCERSMILSCSPFCGPFEGWLQPQIDLHGLVFFSQSALQQNAIQTL
jgi:hypothetical protein